MICGAWFHCDSAAFDEFSTDTSWYPFGRTLRTLTLVRFVAFALQICHYCRRSNHGLANQFFVASAVTWVFAVALRMRAISPTSDELKLRKTHSNLEQPPVVA